MWNEPTPEQLAKLPKLYETEKVPLKDKPVYIHFFIGVCDWFVSEYDGEDLFFGYAIIGNPIFAEWGYISFTELKEIKINGWLEIDCETEDFWRIRKAGEVEKIQCAEGWPDPHHHGQPIEHNDHAIRPA